MTVFRVHPRRCHRARRLLPECLDDYITEDNPVRAVDAFVEELDLEALGFARAAPASTGRPAYHPGVLLKLYIYGYFNRVASSRCLERECQSNVELMWLTGRLSPDFKTMAAFRLHADKDRPLASSRSRRSCSGTWTRWRPSTGRTWLKPRPRQSA